MIRTIVIYIYVYVCVCAANLKILTMIYCTGCENPDMRHFE